MFPLQNLARKHTIATSPSPTTNSYLPRETHMQYLIFGANLMPTLI